MVPTVDYRGFLQHFGAKCCIFMLFLYYLKQISEQKYPFPLDSSNPW